MNVIAGQTYYLVVDEWLSNTGNGYQLLFGGTAILDCQLFPIELIYFGAEYQNDTKSALITWGANSDYDSEYFVVEKSFDGIEFDSVNTSYAYGEGRFDYQYVDNNPVYNGFTYYRLKWAQGDVFHYSDVTAIAVDDPTNQIVVQPNPFVDFITIKSFGDYYGPCQVSVYDMTGQIKLQQNLQFGISNKIEIDTKGLSTGFYTVIVNTEGFTKSFKMTK
jgi:hypothetical protein